MKNTLIVLLGPTGVGKTDVSIELAERTHSEIISADSRQFYKEMETGTAVPSAEQLSRVKHHFIRFISVHDYYSASIYERDVLKTLPSLFSKNSIVIMTGGSALYIDAVCKGIDDIPDVDPEVREKYNRMYAENGTVSLRMALKVLDPEHYSNVDLRNHKRIIRALEICESTGRPYSSFLNKEKPLRDFDIVTVGLEREREDLYDRINRRVDEMINKGLEAEAQNLYPLRRLNALNTVGYKEFFDFFDGLTSREKAIELIKRNTRRYAKRQMTWWAKDQSIKWFHPDEKDRIMEMVAI